jgi:hypothetical protein
MQIVKQFATDSTSLDEHLDQLIEVLAELLEDHLGPRGVFARMLTHSTFPC